MHCTYSDKDHAHTRKYQPITTGKHYVYDLCMFGQYQPNTEAALFKWIAIFITSLLSRRL